jgi:hypothetical protein
MKVAGIVLALVLLVGCSSDSGGGSCPVEGLKGTATCNDCLKQNCCAEIESCASGTACQTCANTGACTAQGQKDFGSLVSCDLNHCQDACPAGGSGNTGVGVGGTSTGATGGDVAVIGGSGGTGGSVSMTCATPCGADCCKAGAICTDDRAGNTACAIKCKTNSACPPASPVCSLFADGSSGCTEDIGKPQRCAVSTDCKTGACAPNIDTTGNPVGVYVCVPNDNGPYHGCSRILTSCNGGHCCFTDAKKNEFCARPCANDAECGAGQYVAYDNSSTTCTQTMGCGL